MRRAVIAWGIALLSVALHGQEMPKNADRWVRVSAGNFHILTDAGEGRALKMAETIQRLTEAVDHATQFETASDRPTVIFAFRRAKDFRSYRDLLIGAGTDRVGLFVARQHADYILLDAMNRETEPLLLHELTHQFVANTFPHAPLWLNEGLAELFGTFERRGDRVLFGVPDPGALELLRRQPLMPISQMLEMSGTAEEFLRGRRVGLIYAQSWAMAHYILIGNDSTRSRLGDYLTRVMRGEPSGTAFSEAFGITPDQMEKEIQRYVHRPTMKHLSATLRAAERQTSTAREASSSELLSELGSMLLDLGDEGQTRAEPFLREAIRLDPRNALAHAALGDLEMATGARDAAIKSYEAALEIDPGHRRAVARSMTTASPRRIIFTFTAERDRFGDHKAEIQALREETLRELEAAKTPEEREHLEKILAATGGVPGKRSPDELYEEAIRLANAQKIDEALELIEQLLSSTLPDTMYHLGALDLKRQIESQRSGRR
ncbi:MAG: hypothetical protein LC732_02330 [Acidobacteria bacterium]|nr:hypothetical protein [Acidobacteriota bacterium]